MVLDRLVRFALAVTTVLACPDAMAQTPGVDTEEIRLGNTAPYTGPAAAYGAIGETLEAYFDMINDQGGVNGRLIRFISYDDGYSPPRSIEAVRRLVEQDDVLMLIGTVGTASNLAIREYLNLAGIPQLFTAAGTAALDDPARYPWTMPWNANYQAEGEAFANYIRATFPGARIGVLYQNDDLGADYLSGLRRGLGEGWDIVSIPYDVTDATVDNPIRALRSAGVQVLVHFSTPRVAVQAIRLVGELGWQLPQLLASVSSSIAVMEPAGVENGIGVVTALYSKDPSFAGWASDPDMQAYRAFMAEYFPQGDVGGVFEAFAYSLGFGVVEVLRRAGDDLTRANVMLQAASLANVEVPGLVPGITLNTGPGDFAPIEQFQLARFDGTAFVPFGELINVVGE